MKTGGKKKPNQQAETIARMSAAFKALSNETRLAVFENIRMGRGRACLDEKKGMPVCSVASNFNISLSTISHHLKELRRADLIRCDRHGQTIL